QPSTTQLTLLLRSSSKSRSGTEGPASVAKSSKAKSSMTCPEPFGAEGTSKQPGSRRKNSPSWNASSSRLTQLPQVRKEPTNTASSLSAWHGTKMDTPEDTSSKMGRVEGPRKSGPVR